MSFQSWSYVNISCQGSLVTCEFLLQNAANVNQQDAQGRGPLHHATMLGHTGFVLHVSSSLLTQNVYDPVQIMCDKPFSLFQASVFVLKKRSESKCCRHWRENTPDNSSGCGQRRHRHTVSVVINILVLFFCVFIYVIWESCLSFLLNTINQHNYSLHGNIWVFLHKVSLLHYLLYRST